MSETPKSLAVKIGAALISIFSAVFFFLKFFKASEPSKLAEFPSEPTKKAESEVKETKKELKAVDKKQYSDEEIEKSFNK